MTAKELVDKLSKLPPQTVVSIDTSHGDNVRYLGIVLFMAPRSGRGTVLLIPDDRTYPGIGWIEL